MSRRVLVTGASGFVGACAVRALLAKGDQVHVLLRDPRRAWRLFDIASRLTIHVGDLVDAAIVRACLNTASPDVVLHLAAHGAYEHQTNAGEIFTTNILGVQNLLESAEAAGVGLFVQAGSSSEYGYRDEAMVESDRLEPNSTYAVAKAAQTHLGQLWTSRHALPVVTLRLFSVYGPWEEPTRLIPTLVRRARAGLPLEMVDPETARDFVYVDDVLDALCDFERLPALRGEVINIGSGRESKMRDIVGVITTLLGSRSSVRWGAFPSRRWDASRWVADVGKAERLLNWRPRHSLEAGLAKMAAWMKTVGDGYGPQVCRAAG